MKHLILLLLLTSCMKTEILNAPIPITKQTDTTKKVRTEADTTRTEDPRVPMGFNPTVEDWNETETEINT